MKFILAPLATMVLAVSGQAQEWLDRMEDLLTLRSQNGVYQARLSGLFDLEGYYIDQRPPGLLQSDESFVNYRASFFVDASVGKHLYGFVQARLDRGFDPGASDFEARLDEYFLRYNAFDDNRLNLQAGKFATVVGNWVARHYSWDNPLITAPLPYQNLTIVSAEDVPESPADFLARRQQQDDKSAWLPVIWGPAYTTGAEIFGNVGKFDYAADIKNAAISSNPYSWDLDRHGWRYPTFSAKLGYQPSEAWNHAVSFSYGPYLNSEAESDLPSGHGLGDYNQITLNYNTSYAWHRWQLWGEVFLTRFEVPNVGKADVLSYYLEANYKITAGLFAAARWNQQLFGTVSDGFGGSQTWGNDAISIDLALGYRFTRHLQAKLQYSFNHRDGPLQQGQQLVATQVTLKF